MSAVLRSRPTLIPLAVAAAAGVVLLPAAIPNSVPSALAAHVVSESSALVESAATNAAASAASLLAQTPMLLKTLPLGDTANFLAAPQANAPLVNVLNGSSTTATASRAFVGPALAAAAPDPTADLIAALQSAIGKLSDAFNAAPTDLIKTGGQLLDGDLRTALQTLSNIIVKPLVLIGLVDLPNISSALSQLAPFFAPVFNAIPNIAINIVVTNLQLFTNARESFATIYEGVRDALKAGDLGAAGTAITTGFSNILAQGNIDLFGENGVVAALKQSGDDFLAAINQLGKPAPTATNTLRVSSNSVSVPSTETSKAAATAADESASGSSKAAADTTSPATESAATAPEVTKTETSTPEKAAPQTIKPESTKTETITPAPTKTETAGTTAGSTPVATQSGTAQSGTATATTSGAATSGAATGATGGAATASPSAAPTASKAGGSATPAAAASASE